MANMWGGRAGMLTLLAIWPNSPLGVKVALDRRGELVVSLRN